KRSGNQDGGNCDRITPPSRACSPQDFMAKRKKKSAMTTASILTQLPLQIGNVFLSQLGRAGQWTLARYMKAPLASTGLLAMVTLTALAGSNALYFQTADHPSPFFGPIRA